MIRIDLSFMITLAFIILSTVLIAFIRRKNLDKCLRDFNKDNINLVINEDITFIGKLRVENTGFELVFQKMIAYNASYILYKNEFANIKYIIRYYEDQTEKSKKRREWSLKNTYHPSLIKKMIRNIQNSFRILRDSLLEVINLIIGSSKNKLPIVGSFNYQDKYMTQIKKEIVDAVGTSYEPLLEKIIGKKVVIIFNYNGTIEKFIGILKEYSTDFIQLLNVQYEEHNVFINSDVIFLRKYATVKHLAE
ncbi:MAG: hypothetical protein GX287_06440 [Fusobacteria bacterium]|jgi:hypothetical protein|nr:hypothetical protein [Fusobacteriota bacterium]